MAHMKSGWMSWSGMALVAAVVLGGCAMSDEKAASLMVAPGDYDLYSCPQLAVAAAPLRKRRMELHGLMARADVDAGGRMMSTIGYRPEYLTISGELHSIDATARHISDSSCLLGLASASFFACFGDGNSSCARRS